MSDLLSRARDAEDLDCPSRDCGSICQGELIREMADEIERLRAEVALLRNELNGIWDAMREAHVSYAEKPIAETIVNLAELARDRAAEIERLRAVVGSKLHQRKCHDCGHVGWYVDSRIPYCLCDRCRSQDTRRVKGAT